MEKFSCKYPGLLKKKLSLFTPETTRVVADFDSTITTSNGRTSWSLLADSGLMPDEYVKRRQALKNMYYLYELNTSLSDEFRSSKMQEWWIGHLMLFVEFGLDRNTLQKVVRKEMIIRSGMDNLLRSLDVLSIPVLILSSGLTESIHAVLDANSLISPQLSIASNSLAFNSTGICSGLQGERIIHPLNKDEWDAPESAQNIFSTRPNILLFGDSLDDMKMVEDSKKATTVSVWFCTSSRLHQREIFDETFDIVVESDNSDSGVGEWLLEKIKENTK